MKKNGLRRFFQYNTMEHAWEKFSREKITKIFTEKKTIIDIGGGLRVDNGRGNRYDKKNEWIKPYLSTVDYKIMDKVSDYNPDIVGDIHALPFAENTIDAIFCISVLEHVEEPRQAVQEMRRALKPGGYCFVYVPFLYYYHAEKGYYKDFYRFTRDGVEYLMRDFSVVEIENVRGAIATAASLFPFFSKHTNWAELLDRLFKKEKSRQTSGYIAFGVK